MEYAHITMSMDTAVVIDPMLKAIMKDPTVFTTAYLDTLSEAELRKIKQDLTDSGVEIIKSLLYINEKLCKDSEKAIG